MKNTKKFLLLLSLIFSVFLFSSCDSKKNTSDEAKSESSSVNKYDFAGLDSQKYAEIFSRKDPDTKYTLKWHYSGNNDEAVNYICYNGKKGFWALKMTPPLFSDNNFIVKDKKLIDLYEKEKKYLETDMDKEAESLGYFSYEYFENYVCDIFSGMYYLGSGEDEIDGKQMKYDSFFTDKQVKLKLYTDDDGKLNIIEPVREENSERIFMYIDEFSDDVKDEVFNIPSDYSKEEA